jgi:two-component system CAI-1 autoinducer sensor kinase/phosphatase CqsS
MSLPLAGLDRLIEHLRNATVESAHLSRYNAPMIGLLGVILLPAYYFVWTDIFPQPYESLPLRLVGAALCIPLIVANHWPARLQRFFPVYWLVAMTYIFPFLFTYLLLRNDLSLIWSMSTITACFMLILAVYDWLLALLLTVLGVLLAWLAFMLGDSTALPPGEYVQQLMVYAFAIVVGSVFNHTALLVKEEKLAAYSAVGSNIAHELRTPLLGIRAAVAGISHHLPDMLDAYEKALAADLPVKRIRPARLDSLRDATARIEEEITYSNTVIEMLLVSAGHTTLRSDGFAIHSANQTIEQALVRYPFNSAHERELLHWEKGEDFDYFGSDILVMHVLFNLIKNALHSVLATEGAIITLDTQHSSDHNTIRIQDTGKGISPKEMPHIFEHFYSSKSIGQGAGVGLAFCKLAMDSMSGNIDCTSTVGERTIFTLGFPEIVS